MFLYTLNLLVSSSPTVYHGPDDSANVLDGRKGAMAGPDHDFIYISYAAFYFKVCMVTGAARGLGFEFCKAFVQS